MNRKLVTDLLLYNLIHDRLACGCLCVPEVQIPNTSYRADLVVIQKKSIYIYELKSCLEDYNKDKKYQKYRDYCHFLNIVSPQSVDLTSKLPEWVGYYQLLIDPFRWDTWGLAQGIKKITAPQKNINPKISLNEWSLNLLGSVARRYTDYYLLKLRADIEMNIDKEQLIQERIYS